MVNEACTIGATGALLILSSFVLNGIFNAFNIDDTDLAMWGIAIGFPLMGLAVAILIVMQIIGE